MAHSHDTNYTPRETEEGAGKRCVLLWLCDLQSCVGVRTDADDWISNSPPKIQAAIPDFCPECRVTLHSDVMGQLDQKRERRSRPAQRLCEEDPVQVLQQPEASHHS